MKQPNMILIVMDCARPDHMSYCGYHRQTTPYLDQLAAKGIWYENATTASPWSLPSHWSLFTGLFPARHGVWYKYLALSPHYRTIAQILNEEGYETVAFSSNPHIGIKNGFNRGFDIFEELFRVREKHTLLNLTKRAANKLLLTVFKLKYAGAYQTNRLIKKWLAGRPNQQRPFFLFVNYMEVHEPYQPPWPYRSRFMDQRVKTASKTRMADYAGKRRRLSDWEIERDRALYDAELAFLDAQLRSLFGYMERQGFLNNTVLILTSDHGQHLGEHGYIGHGTSCLHDPGSRVPLILYGPRILPSAVKISQQVQLVDIVPTILAILGHQQDDRANQLQGQSLLPEDLAAFDERPAIIHSRYLVAQEERELIAIRTDGYKYIWRFEGKDELYDLKQDPGEAHNLVDQKQTKANELQTYLRDWLSSNGPLQQAESQGYAPMEVELDEEVEERLRALGYID